MSNLSPLSVPTGSKWCRQCNRIRRLNKFGYDASRRDGKNPWCKDCINAHYQRRRGSSNVTQLRFPPRADDEQDYSAVPIDPSWTHDPRSPDASRVPSYGVPARLGFEGGHVCRRCREWHVHAFYSPDDTNLCKPCYRDVQEMEDTVVWFFSDPPAATPVPSPPPVPVGPSPAIPPTPMHNRLRMLRLTRKPELVTRIIAGLPVDELLGLAEGLGSDDGLVERLVELALELDGL